VYRILIFYIGALAVLLSLYPWQKVVQGGSPFVMIFHELDSDLVATILNVVVLTAALSVYNSCVYANSRMLFGLASQGDAPRQLLKVSRRGVPLTALGVSAFATGMCVLINYLMPGEAFGLLMALAVSALVINWASISITHLKFRKAKLAAGITRSTRVGHPVSNYLCLAFIVLILVVMYLTPPIRISVMLIPAWILVLWVAFKLKKARQARHGSAGLLAGLPAKRPCSCPGSCRSLPAPPGTHRSPPARRHTPRNAATPRESLPPCSHCSTPRAHAP
jgi:aromatic amino acid transport protein AroP